MQMVHGNKFSCISISFVIHQGSRAQSNKGHHFLGLESAEFGGCQLLSLVPLTTRVPKYGIASAGLMAPGSR